MTTCQHPGSHTRYGHAAVCDVRPIPSEKKVSCFRNVGLPHHETEQSEDDSPEIVIIRLDLALPSGLRDVKSVEVSTRRQAEDVPQGLIESGYRIEATEIARLAKYNPNSVETWKAKDEVSSAHRRPAESVIWLYLTL
ncbi:hypothetical protein PAXRUDRAFT_9479 [Paxillus rubicundulus Ve08.2h10]|uniref:Uncharacterized protein n=1 Tax=Paxillus rubicundulus Ve08.2h10 TaxID=930991 RepID=A0A0D0E354_9AGAM|nr:hypothetical protein PAXRUDRAFT_9479 [Paxillus rubicundulus Ve08.2h10]